MSTTNVTLVEVIDKMNSHLPEKPNFKLVFYPVNQGFVINEAVLNITRNYLSSLCVRLIQVGTNEDALVQVKKISMPNKGESIEDYLNRIDSILKDLDDHAKFLEF